MTAKASRVVRWAAGTTQQGSEAAPGFTTPFRGSRLRADLVQQRLRVQRVEAEASRDLLAGRLRALAEELRQELAGLAIPPPVRTDLVDEVRAQLRGADPRAEVVGGVEARVHVGEVVVLRVPDPRRLGE